MRLGALTKIPCSLWLAVKRRCSLDSLTKVFSSVGSVATAAALIFLAWQASEAERQTELTAYQTESDNLAKTSELVRYIQLVQSQTLKLKQWRSLTDHCGSASPQRQSCTPLRTQLGLLCSTGHGQNPLCSANGVGDWVRTLADQKVEKRPLSPGDEILWDGISKFLKADVIGDTRQMRLAGDMSAALDTCAYFVGQNADASLNAWREMQVALRAAGALDQLRTAIERFSYRFDDPDGGSKSLSDMGSEGLSRCPRLADMWYRGLAAGTAATGGGGGEGANSDRIPGEFPKRVELRRVPV